MKIFDSLKNKKWIGKGFDIKSESILILKSANFNHSLFLQQGNYKLKIVGKKRTGSGKVVLEILTDENEILLKKEINFNNNSWSEFSFDFEAKSNLGNGKIRFIREKNIYGSVEIGRVYVDLNLDVNIEKTANPKMIGKKNFKNYQFIEEKKIKTLKKIVFIVPYQIYGGAEVYIQNLISQFDSNYQINIIYLHDNKLQSYLNGSHIHHRVIKNLSQLEGILKSHQYDYIIYYNRLDVYNILLELKKSKELNSKLIEIYHSDFIWPGSLSSIKTRNYVDKIIAISKSLALDIENISSDTREIIPIGIDTEKFSPRQNINLRNSIGAQNYKGIIGTVARLSKEKQLDYVINLAKQMPDYFFVIVGEGPEEKKLKHLAKDLNNIQFAGFQKNPSEYYNIFDAFVLASKIEGTPLSILEAMSSGVPVFSNMVGAIPDIIENGVTGFKLTSDINEDIKLITNNLHNKRIIKNARSYIEEHHDIKKNYEKFIRAIFNAKFSIIEKKENNINLLAGEYI